MRYSGGWLYRLLHFMIRRLLKIFPLYIYRSYFPDGKLIGRPKEIGDFTVIDYGGNVKFGKNVKIGAGAVVTEDIPTNSVAVGVPARVVKTKDNQG